MTTGHVAAVYARLGNTDMSETDPPKAETWDGRAEAKGREENAGKARETADRLFPGHGWEKVEDGIYLSPRRAVGKKSSYKDELRNAHILRDLGSTVYFVPESKRQGDKKFDAIVDGLNFEFKNVTGGTGALQRRFLESRAQAPNVFINLENSSLTTREIMSALYGARNSPKYPEISKFSGGMILLKVKGMENLVCLNTDDLKAG